MTSPGAPMAWIKATALPFVGDECLKWPFADAGNGYGRIWLNGKSTYAHRVVCEMAHGFPPSVESEASHSCGKGHEGCCNPRHLSWKTRSGNFADKVQHGTHNRGEQHPLAKLTEGDVDAIRASVGSVSQRELARTFGVSQQTISDVVSRQRWGWKE